jgi:hypothetical protein
MNKQKFPWFVVVLFIGVLLIQAGVALKVLNGGHAHTPHYRGLHGDSR